MEDKEILNIIEQRRNADPAFREKYDLFFAKRSGKAKLSDDDLDVVNGGFYDETECPNCKEGTLITWTMGIWSYCNKCKYTEWGRGWH